MCALQRLLTNTSRTGFHLGLSLDDSWTKRGGGGLGSASAALHWFGGGRGSLLPRSHLHERDQVRASLQRKQKAFNPLISEI